MRNRRAASVPAEDLSYRRVTFDTSCGPFNKSFVTSAGRTADDTEALTAASRRNDEYFLNDISTKLAAANLARPITIESRVVPPPPPPGSDHRRRTWYGQPGGPPVTDYEVNSYLSSGRKPVSNHYPRCSSVPPPPIPGSRSSVQSAWSGAPSRGWAPKWTPSPGYSREARLPYEDVVVGVAHTSLYGDIVIGIPYNKRFMFNAQRENGIPFSGNYYQPSHYSSRSSISPSNGKPSLYSSSVPPKPSYRRASISAPYRNIYDDVDDEIYIPKTYRCSSSLSKPRIDTSDFDLEFPVRKPTFDTKSSVHARPYSAMNGYVNGDVNRSSTPVSTGLSAKPPRAVKPPISDARRKVRDLLCRTKNDPHYFEY